jgi:glyoxylase-like metal-dependent hydrolase (beta-lactamase superfamily II)
MPSSADAAPAASVAPTVIEYGEGILAVDSGYVRPMLAAVHLVIERDRAAVVDTGSNDSVPAVLAELARRGIGPEQVDWVLLTHVHLDHAGGAGELMRRCPNARAAVHPRGVRHMADPSKLIAGTIGVYGEEATRRLYGDVVPIDPDRIVAATEDVGAQMGAREFRFLDTPGHARHHVCIVDSRTGHVFTGDTFGLSYRELDIDGRQFVFPSVTPVQFDPERMRESIDRIEALRPGAVYVTHFGQARDVPRLASDLRRLTDAHVALARRWRDAGADRQARLEEGLTSLLLDESRRQGWRLVDDAVVQLFSHDVALNAAGLIAWLDS